MSRNSTTIKKGDRLAAGKTWKQNVPPNFCTQALVSALNEVDKDTSKEKIYTLVDNLWKLAIGYKYKRKNSDGTEYEVDVQPDLAAIREILDRVQGKPKQELDLSGAITVSKEMTLEEARIAAAAKNLPSHILIDVTPTSE